MQNHTGSLMTPGKGSQNGAPRTPPTEPTTSTGNFKFVNLSHPEGIREDNNIRTEIRRHVMKNIGQQRRRPRPKAKLSSRSSALRPQTAQANVATISRHLVPISGLPVDVDSQVRELLHFSKRN